MVERFPAGTELRLVCGGDAHALLRRHPAVEEVRLYAPGRGKTRALVERLRTDRRLLQSWSPSVVVSDGDGPSVHAAWSLGFRVLAIGHGLMFRHTRLEERLPPLQLMHEVINAGSSSWPAARRIAVHFAPVMPKTRGTDVARPDLPIPAEPPGSREDFILAYFRDDNGMQALRWLVSRGHRILLFGQARHAPPGVEVREPKIDAFVGALARCHAVVGSAGNQLPAECAMLGVPMLALHRHRDPEQAPNARLIEAAGIGVGGAFDRCDLGLTRRFEAGFDRDRSHLAARTRAMKPVSEVVARVVDELSGRGHGQGQVAPGSGAVRAVFDRHHPAG